MLGILLLPLVLITLNTVASTLTTTGVLAEVLAVAATMVLVGQTSVALLVTVLVAIGVLGLREGRTRDQVQSLVDGALEPICSIILITGAGGMFGGVLELSGIGEALSGSLENLGLPLIVSAFVIATLLRVAQGSATVALVTTAGLIAPGWRRPTRASANWWRWSSRSPPVRRCSRTSTTRASGWSAGSSRWTKKSRCAPGRSQETTLGLTAFALAGLLWVVA